MPYVTLDDFKRAAADIAAHGDNDTLPFDADDRFIAGSQDAVAQLAFNYSEELEKLSKKGAKNEVESLTVFSERLLVPTGSAGFRITTKIHPFWNVYLNGLAISVARALEPTRSDRAHSYRFTSLGEGLFDRTASWRAFREATVAECKTKDDDAIVVQTDISSFYEYVSHHRLENSLERLLPDNSTVPTQIDRFLSKFAGGRSFGLPVGGQCSRVLAEALLASIDSRLQDEKVIWRRYVDDFCLIATSQADAYRVLSILAHALADYGLTLNRTKTTLLTTKHYVDYVRTQLGGSDDEAGKLAEIDLHFDPYSDTRDSDYEELKQAVESLDIRALLDLELGKSQPDNFLIAQIGRTLKFHSPKFALALCGTLLAPANLHAFRASWAKIMRGIAAVCADERFSAIFSGLDKLLDEIPNHSAHLLRAEASCLYYLRAIRFRRTPLRAQFVLTIHTSTTSATVKQACIDCWRNWKDQPSFTRERNRWQAMSSEEQRMLWLAGSAFGDEGSKFRLQTRQSLRKAWKLGIEHPNGPSFASIYAEWAANDH
jgi:Reverse transcriptase (RNA-dependent DNA polymerase)